uniref:VWA domain-containing protein n=1 Tax=Pristionchus pacificus TaxID=54126 RepID=A0A2A6BGJ8_PRIPA|eukprot:PDM64978.1 VWA domain-containing protein [Pristionchus pacificus]
MLLTLIHLIIVVETVKADLDRLPYILSFAEDPKSRDKNQAFVRREASNQAGFNHYALRSLSRASFVDAHDITDHRPFASMNEGTQFYDERRNFAIVRDRELAFGPNEYDPDFYDAVAAQTFDERTSQSTVSHPTVTLPPPTTTATVPPTVPPSVPTVTYASFPLREIFPSLFFNAPQPFLVTTTARPYTVLTTPRTIPTTTTIRATTSLPTTQTTTSQTTTIPTITTTVTTTWPPTTVSTTVSPDTIQPQPSTVSIESKVTPLLLLKTHHNSEQRDSPFFRSEIVNNPRRYCRDAIFVLDNSGSTKFNFERLKLLIGSLADLVFEDSARRVGMITFSSRHRQRIVYDWMQPRTEDASKDFHRKLKELTFAGGITQLGAALAMLQDRLFDESLQRGSASRPIDIVLFTDGYSFDDPSIIASNLRLSGHRIYIAALFTSYLRSELDSITGDPSRVVTEMEGLDTLAHSLHTCF